MLSNKIICQDLQHVRRLLTRARIYDRYRARSVSCSTNSRAIMRVHRHRVTWCSRHRRRRSGRIPPRRRRSYCDPYRGADRMRLRIVQHRWLMANSIVLMLLVGIACCWQYLLHNIGPSSVAYEQVKRQQQQLSNNNNNTITQKMDNNSYTKMPGPTFVSQKHGTITASGLQALQNYSFSAMQS